MEESIQENWGGPFFSLKETSGKDANTSVLDQAGIAPDASRVKILDKSVGAPWHKNALPKEKSIPAERVSDQGFLHTKTCIDGTAPTR